MTTFKQFLFENDDIDNDLIVDIIKRLSEKTPRTAVDVYYEGYHYSGLLDWVELTKSGHLMIFYKTFVDDSPKMATTEFIVNKEDIKNLHVVKRKDVYSASPERLTLIYEP